LPKGSRRNEFSPGGKKDKKTFPKSQRGPEAATYEPVKSDEGPAAKKRKKGQGTTATKRGKGRGRAKRPRRGVPETKRKGLVPEKPFPPPGVKKGTTELRTFSKREGLWKLKEKKIKGLIKGTERTLKRRGERG